MARFKFEFRIFKIHFNASFSAHAKKKNKKKRFCFSVRYRSLDLYQ